MEEKERFELFGEHCIKDNNPDARCQLLSAYVACVILNEQDKHIKDLESKLAESEKENKTLKDIRTLERVVPRNAQLHKLSNRDCYLKGFENAISETIRTFEETYGKEKCKLIEERNKYLMDIVKVGGYEYQIEELKQQLAEKEKELKKIKNLRATPKQLQRAYQERYKYKERCNELKNQHLKDKISFAVEQLEKVKELFESCWDYYFDIGELCNKELFYNKIEQLIAELTHQHEDKGEQK